MSAKLTYGDPCYTYCNLQRDNVWTFIFIYVSVYGALCLVVRASDLTNTQNSSRFPCLSHKGHECRNYRNLAWWIIDEVGGRGRCDGGVDFVYFVCVVKE